MENVSQMSLLEAAIKFMEGTDGPQQINKIVEEALTLKGIDKENKEAKTQLYVDITTSAKFVYLGDENWDLKSRQSLDEWDKDGSAFNTVDLEEEDDDDIDVDDYSLDDVKKKKSKDSDEDDEDEDLDAEDEDSSDYDSEYSDSNEDDDSGNDEFDSIRDNPDDDESFDEDEYDQVMDDYEDLYDDNK